MNSDNEKEVGEKKPDEDWVDTPVSDGGNSAPLAGSDSADSPGHSHASNSETKCYVNLYI